MKGTIANNVRPSFKTPISYEDMTPLQKAYADMVYAKHKGGFAYKQAKRHYEKLQRRSKE